MAPTAEMDSFIYLCITNLKDNTTIQPDFQKVGEALGIKQHSAYCRWRDIMKKAQAGAKNNASGDVATSKGAKTKPAPKAAAGRKRKQDSVVEDDEEEVPKAKVKKGKGVKVKNEPVDGDSEEGRERFVTPAESFGGAKSGRESEEQGYDEAFMGI